MRANFLPFNAKGLYPLFELKVSHLRAPKAPVDDREWDCRARSLVTAALIPGAKRAKSFQHEDARHIRLALEQPVLGAAEGSRTEAESLPFRVDRQEADLAPTSRALAVAARKKVTGVLTRMISALGDIMPLT